MERGNELCPFQVAEVKGILRLMTFAIFLATYSSSRRSLKIPL